MIGEFLFVHHPERKTHKHGKQNSPFIPNLTGGSGRKTMRQSGAKSGLCHPFPFFCWCVRRVFTGLISGTGSAHVQIYSEWDFRMEFPRIVPAFPCSAGQDPKCPFSFPHIGSGPCLFLLFSLCVVVVVRWVFPSLKTAGVVRWVFHRSRCFRDLNLSFLSGALSTKPIQATLRGS